MMITSKHNEHRDGLALSGLPTWLALALLLSLPCGIHAQEHWPEGAAPTEVGKRVAENIYSRPFRFEGGGGRNAIIYPEVCAWYGALQVAQLTGDTNLQERLVRRFDPFLTPDGAPHLPERRHVDDNVFGAVPLEIYIQTGNKDCLALGTRYADRQWEHPTEDGITEEARYWVDDIYMISAVQVQAYRATGDTTYLDRAARTTAAYLDKLQQPNGLFLHAEDSPFFWGRGNGWFAAGMTELLRELPQDHPNRARIMEGYKKMMAALLKHQNEGGLWRQLIDKQDSWPETSSTGMFTFAMVTGVKHGWLDEETYGPATRKAWLALVAQLDADDNVKNVCVGTNKGQAEVGPDLDEQRAYYLSRPRRTGDLHGQAPILWTAAAMLRPAPETPSVSE